MARWVAHLLCELEDLSSGPQTRHKSLVGVAAHLELQHEKVETRDLQNQVASKTSHIGKLWV